MSLVGGGDVGPSAERESVGGLGQLVTVLKMVVVRPRFGEAPPRKQAGRFTRRRGGLPMLCLVREPNQEVVLSQLSEYLMRAWPRRVPYVHYSFPPVEPRDPANGAELPVVTEEQVNVVASVLLAVAQDLSSAQNSTYGRFRFRRFHLVYWLMKGSFQGDSSRRDEVLQERLLEQMRERDLSRRKNKALLQAAEQGVLPHLSWWAQLAIRIAPSVWFRMRLSRFVPFVGSEYRWMLHQPYLAPRDPGTVVGFAERIASALVDVEAAPRAGTHVRREDPEELLRLLVNAFLEDVRRLYRRPFWHPSGARRTVYPVVLVDNISRRNGGYLLFKTINEVRNGTGVFDPVVFISGSHRVPPRAREREDSSEPGEKAWWVAESEGAYSDWCDRFRSSSRKREPAAWYLSIKIPEAVPEQPDAPPLASIEAAPPPVWSRAAVLAVVALVVVAGVAVVAGQRVSAHCGYTPLNRNYPTLHLLDDGQCIGVSDEPIPLTGAARNGNDSTKIDLFNDVQARIVAQNARVAELHKTTTRLYMTLVYLTAFSAEPYTLASEKERLMGVAARQAEALDSSQDVLVRILFANAGHQMQSGERVAGIIGELAGGDPSIVGVIGLAQSRADTVAAVRGVSAAGLPMIAATLSADPMPAQSLLYFQVSPQNSREVGVLASYLRRPDGGKPAVTAVRIVHSADTSDIYSANLSTIASQTLAQAGFKVESEPYVPSGTTGENIKAIAGRLCGLPRDEAVLFAGRPGDFDTMMREVRNCLQQEKPRIFANDDVSRYVADSKLMASNEVPFTYISFGLGTRGCSGESSLNRKLREIFAQACNGGLNPSLDGHAALAYDAMSAFVNAVEPGVQPKVVNLVSKLYDTSFPGASGNIEFRNSPVRGVPRDKFLAVMSAEPHQDVRIVGYCGGAPRVVGEGDPLVGVPVVCPEAAAGRG
jgi:hypothetical protein